MFTKNIAYKRSLTSYKLFKRHVRRVAVLVLLLTGIATFGYVAYQPSFALSGVPASISAPIEPTPTPTPPTSNGIIWITNTVSLKAGNFYMVIDGKQYLANNGNVNVRSDPGNPTYTTLETTWQENGVEMRMYMYFSYTLGQFWRLYELRTYNGQENGDWIMYNATDANGNPIQHELGQAYVNAGPLEFRNVTNSQYRGLIHFENFRLQAFLNQPAPIPTVEGFKRALGSVRGAPNYDSLYDVNGDGRISAVDYSALLTRFAFLGYYLEQNPSSSIVMGVGTSYAIHALLRDAQGNVVTYQQGLTYSWSESPLGVGSRGGGSPLAASITITPFSSCTQGIQPPCPEDHLTIQALTPGDAAIRVRVTRNSDQTEMAQALFYPHVVSESLVYFNNLSPNGGETLTVGQSVTVRWSVTQGAYDYAYISYEYNDGQPRWRFIDFAWYGTNQLNWVIPSELVGRRARIVIQPIRSNAVVGQGISDSYFTVSPASTTAIQSTSCTFDALKKAFYSRKGDAKYNSSCDLNNDGIINIRDFGLLRRSLRR